MLNLHEIYKPKTLAEGLALLQQPNTVALAGGTDLLARRRKDIRAVVDLRELGLAYIRDKDGAVAIGAMTTLADVAESTILRAAANSIIAQAAQRSASSILRNQATITGTLIAESDGILAVALLALDARIICFGTETTDVALADFLATRERFAHSIVTEVVIPRTSLHRRASIETVARTPRDKPIVSVCVALEIDNDVVRTVMIALGGVGKVAIHATAAEKILVHGKLDDSMIEEVSRAAMEDIDPPSDFRGSTEYRRAMVQVLTARALRENKFA